MVLDNFESVMSDMGLEEDLIKGLKPILLENIPKIQALNKTCITNIYKYENTKLILFEEYDKTQTYLIGLVEPEEENLFFIVEPEIKKYINSNIKPDSVDIRCLKAEVGAGYLQSATILKVKNDMLIVEKIKGTDVEFKYYDKESLEYIFNHLKFGSENNLFIDVVDVCIKDNNICPDATFQFCSGYWNFNYRIYKNNNFCFGDKVEIDGYIVGSGYVLFKSLLDSIDINKYLQGKDFCTTVQKIKCLSKEQK